ncbi:discoidin domain-containing protein, partial [Spirilliplanes yamanashiensis]
ITNSAITVTFSDGRTLNVPAGKTATTGALTWSGGNATGGGVTPTTQPTTGGPTTQPTTPGPTTPTPTQGCTTAPLLSQGRTATSSSIESGYPANLAVDGNTGTRWSSAFADPQWIQVDLGSTQNLSRVELNWEAAFGQAYTIQTSTNGTTWTTAATVTNGDGGADSLNVSGSARYVRMNGTTRGTPYGYSLWEFKVFGACGATTPPTTQPTTTPPTTQPTTQPPTTPPTTTPPAGNAWAPYVSYATGAVVTYNGQRYQCRQAHTSLPGWEPASVPALWLAI